MEKERFDLLVEKRRELQQEGVRILARIRKIEWELRKAGWKDELIQQTQTLKGESK